jgi:hypothetical protein
MNAEISQMRPIRSSKMFPEYNPYPKRTRGRI